MEFEKRRSKLSTAVQLLTEIPRHDIQKDGPNSYKNKIALLYGQNKCRKLITNGRGDVEPIFLNSDQPGSAALWNLS